MTDTREDILARIVTICDGVQTGVTVYRNKTTISDDMRPCVIVLDGDELADEGDANRYGLAPRRVGMSPQIILLVSAADDVVGSAMNDLRALVVRAILEDADLAQFSLQNGSVQYDGASQIIEDGRRVEGALSLAFSVQYLLRPGDLSPASA